MNSPASFREIRPVELLESFRDSIFEKYDPNDLIDIWRKWRLPTIVVCGTLTCAYLLTTKWLLRSINLRLKRRRLRAFVEEKRAERAAKFDRLRERLEEETSDNNNRKVVSTISRRREIVLLNFQELTKRLRGGSLTAVEVLHAYQWRALEAHAQTNCVCDFITEAEEWAAALDSKYATLDNESRPPLFGVPVSVAASFHISGDYDRTSGFASGLIRSCRSPTNCKDEDKDANDAPMIRTLKQMGAVPFAVTNVCYGLLSVGCSNPVFGATSNPNDPIRSAGGSSGGEAALIAMLGSPLGLAADEPGGGCRVPAHWCGICSLKPTSRRFSNTGILQAASAGGRTLSAQTGLMGPSVDSVVSCVRAVCSPGSVLYQTDPYSVPLAFNEELFTDGRPLTIGYYLNDGLLSPTPACSRAVQVAKRILEAKGHLLVQIPPPFSSEEMSELLAYYAAVGFPDSGSALRKTFHQLDNDNGYDDLSRSGEALVQFLSTSPAQKRKLSKRAPSRRLKRVFEVFASTKTISAQEAIWARIDGFKRKFVHFWSERKLDCILCPVAACTPLPEGSAEMMYFLLWSYCALYNLLDFPAGVVRCTTVTIGDERAATMGRDDVEEDWISQEIRRAAEGTVGLPVGVQCVALPFREEMCLRIMKDIENALRRH